MYRIISSEIWQHRPARDIYEIYKQIESNSSLSSWNTEWTRPKLKCALNSKKRVNLL